MYTELPIDVPKRIEHLEQSFARVHRLLMSALARQRISVEALLEALTRLPQTYRKECVKSLEHDMSKPRVATNKLLLLLSPLFTFTDFELFAQLISKLEYTNEYLNKVMDSHLEKVQVFKKMTTVSQITEHWPGRELPKNMEYKLLIAKFDCCARIYTLEKLDRFQSKFYDKLGLSDCVCVSILMSSKVFRNSFFAVWFVPAVIVDEVIEAASQVENQFYVEEHVQELTVNEAMLYQKRIKVLDNPTLPFETLKRTAVFMPSPRVQVSCYENL